MDMKKILGIQHHTKAVFEERNEEEVNSRLNTWTMDTKMDGFLATSGGILTPSSHKMLSQKLIQKATLKKHPEGS
jgi:hypothetical protein